MAEPLKNMFSRQLLSSFSGQVRFIWPDFDENSFLSAVFDEHWPQLELKQRMRHIALCLRKVLPENYEAALDVLVHTTTVMIAGQGEKMAFEYSFLPDFVEVFGLEHPDRSLQALETITRWSSAEFAVRPFLLRYPDQVYAQMLRWSEHLSPLVRRLSSEGFRPRLPWGMGIPALKRAPSPILPVLENLKADPAETVRRSVANNLNDISKDHPELALEIARRWSGHNPQTNWIVRHALRGLLKKGNATALAQFGFNQDADGILVENLSAPASVPLGGDLEFHFRVKNTADTPHQVRLEYGIDYRTGSGKTSRKVFRIKETTLQPGQSESIRKRQRFIDLTTRKHFAGRHVLRVLVNGREMADQVFTLV